MANWCYNEVTFYTKDVEDTNILERVFQDMIDKEDETGQGQAPYIDPERYFFSLYLLEKTDRYISITYETKWYPNLEDIKRIGQDFKCDFEGHYEEFGDMLFGDYESVDGRFVTNYITPEDLEDVEWNQETGDVFYKKELWESEVGLFEYLLNKKITQ